MNIKNRLKMIGPALLPLLLVGCILSGTFMISEPIKFSAGQGFYHYFVDITGQKSWEDHKDHIDNIDLVGFELWINNPGAKADTFSCYVDDPNDAALTDPATLNVNTTKVLNDLVVPAGKASHLTYGNSFKYLMNIDKLKAFVEGGKFHFYGVSTGSFIRVDSGKVVITFSGS